MEMEAALLRLTGEQWKELFPAKFDRDPSGALVTENDWFNKMEASFGGQE